MLVQPLPLKGLQQVMCAGLFVQSLPGIKLAKNPGALGAFQVLMAAQRSLPCPTSHLT
jgi:hypothetical protein